MSTKRTDSRSVLRRDDLLRLGWQGLRMHPIRAMLSALGIAIGIAAMIAVVGISLSSQAKIQERLASLGTNMLTVEAGKSLSGDSTELPADSAARITRIEGVTQVGWIGDLPNTPVYRNAMIDPSATNGITTAVTDTQLLDATSSEMDRGSWFNDATMQYPTTVLGARTAERLGIASPGGTVNIGGQNHTVLGILKPSLLAPQLDAKALVGAPHAKTQFGFTGSPTTLYERSADDAVESVRELIPGTVNPKSPNEVGVSRPSDTLAAQHAVDAAFTGILVGMGSIALLVGGIGVANTMVITVLERRREIGLRRALGATRGHIRKQFLVETVMLAACGGAAGVLLGLGCTAIVAFANGWSPTVPPLIVLLSGAVTIVVGAIAGTLPAIKAAKVSPTEALAT